MRSRTSLPTLAAIALLCALPSRAHAGGYELLPGGTQSVARGGAVAARPEDAMLLEHDPAGLSLLSGNQMLLNIDAPFHHMCEDPYGYYGWGIYQRGSSEFGDPFEVKVDKNGKPIIGDTYATTPLPEVCNSGRVVGLPQLAWVGKLTDDLAIAGGFVAPTLVAGLQFGGADGTIAVDGRALPTPTRYQLIRQQVKFALAPSVGVGYRLAQQLQLGVALQVAMVNATSRAVQNATSGTQPSSDWLVDVNAHDYFIPSLTVSAHSKPIPPLDLMVAFRWTDSFNGSGKATIETNTYHEGSTSGGVPYTNAPFHLSLIEVPVPWALTFGARYAGLLPGADAGAGKRRGLGDPLDRELWDVELDATYELNHQASKNTAQASGNVTVISRIAGGGGDVTTVDSSDLSQVAVDRHMRDAVTVRAGGSFSVLPRKVALEAGLFYETRGQDPAYANIDSFAFARVGFGLGAMWRVGSFDLVAAYGHIFQETVEVAPPRHQVAEQGSKTDPTAGFDQRVGGKLNDFGVRVYAGDPSDDPKNPALEPTVLSDPTAPSPAKADAVARVQQSVAVPNGVRSKRVINAGKYSASFNIVSVGAVYHF